jgi:hypothetical protein
MQDKKQFICTACGEPHPERDYYRSASPMYKAIGRLPICIDCIVDIFNKELDKNNNNLKMTMYIVCRLFNIYYDDNLFLAVQGQSEKKGTNFVQIYFQKVNSLPQYRGKTFADSTFLEEKDKVDVVDFVDDDENFEVTPNMVSKWGKNLNQDDYRYLEEVYGSLIAIYDHKTPIQKMLYEDIARTRLAAQQALRSNQILNYEKMMSTVSKLMQDASIKPSQENGTDEGLSTWGQWIKKIEETEPIPEATDEFKDVDGIRKYILQWFTSHFYKILGIDNGEYDDIDESLEQTIDIIEDDAEEDTIVTEKTENKKIIKKNKKGRGKNG